MRTCEDCVFYEAPKEGYVCFTCGYPVPAYIRAALSGGNFLNYQVNEEDCQTFKSKKDVANEALRGVGDE